MTLLTFIIPVRHQANARDWSLLKKNLSETMASIANQSCRDWQCVIVANEGADLPAPPQQFSIERVTFPPNRLHEKGDVSVEEFRDAFRIDKGRRVLRGMLRTRESRFFMIVDDDDFVSARIVQHVSDHSNANGWTVDRGYIWDEGGRLLLEHDEFNRVCGTSLIIRSELYGMPSCFEEASVEWIRSMLGSHILIPEILAKGGSPLSTLPFRGAVYRVANAGSHSNTPSLLRKYFFSRTAIRRPRKMLQNIGRLRIVNSHAKEEFFGGRKYSRRS